jgi:acyl-CoA synthetase (NDP forming)
MNNVKAATDLREAGDEGYSRSALKRFFEPDSVVLVGAAERTLYTKSTIDNADYFSGTKLHLVNRRGQPVFGRPAARNCVELGEKVDTAFIHVPAAFVLEAMEDAHAAGIRNVVVLSSGFADSGKSGLALQHKLVARAEELGLMLLGPNHVGFVNQAANKSVFALVAPKTGVGNLAVLSQSGGIATEMARFGERQNVLMSQLITLGNEAQISSADALQYVLDCDETKAVLLFMETVNHPQRFAAAARRAAELGKPIIVYKSGVTELAAKSAAAHTGALVGDDKALTAIFEELGVIRVQSLEDLVLTGKLAASLAKSPIRGVGVISASGGSNDIIADVAEPFGVPLAKFSEQTVSAIAATIPDEFVTVQNPLDLTGSMIRDLTLWNSVSGIIANDPSVDLVLCMGALIRSATPSDRDRIVADALNQLDCPSVYITPMASDIPAVSIEGMNEAGFRLYSTGIVPTLRAIGAIANWQRRQAGSDGAEDVTVAKYDPPVASDCKGAWSEWRARSLLSAAGIPVVDAVLAKTEQEAISAANSYGVPVALKIISPDILHKSDIGGVELFLDGDAQVKAGYNRIVNAVATKLPSAKVEGISVSPMRTGGIELLVGIVRDPQWGLLLVVGLGGVFVEVLKDTVIIPLPTSPARVARALSKLRGAAILEGFRGSKAADKEKLSRVISQIGALAKSLETRLESLEINPLLIDGTRIEALDALVTWQ